MTQKKERKERKRREEPVTEIKRVPYKINLRAESDMFEDISDSGMDIEDEQDNQESVEHLQIYQPPDESVPKEDSFNVEVSEIHSSSKKKKK